MTIAAACGGTQTPAPSDPPPVPQAQPRPREQIPSVPSDDELTIRRNLAMALLDENQYAAAAEHLDVVLEHGGDSWWLHLAAAQICLYWRGDYPCVVDHAERALELRPDNTRAHIYLGQAYEEQGDREAAIGHYRAVLQGRADDSGTSMRLAAILDEGGERDEAIAVLQAALAHDAGDARLLLHMAALVEPEDPRYAEQLFTAAAARHENPRLAYFHLVRFYERQGRHREASELRRWIDAQSDRREMRPIQ